MEVDPMLNDCTAGDITLYLSQPVVVVGRVRVEISTVDFLRCGCGSVPAAGASAKKLLFAGHKPSQPALGEQLASSRRWQKM